ncbi:MULTISPECIES: DUF2920 family protein [unclassified Lysinibacillus]|uniref:DUF2920 family protein n=1 Tax=unclassified Lysinibacillus TaxID=2636778 RepID=UPI0037FA8D69
MAYNQELSIPAHPTIYNGNNERTYRIEYSIPQNGTNEDTGIVIFVSGFGGNIDSKVYKKMREVFADTYNLVTVQCDYFGSKFMQGSDSFSYSLSTLEKILSKEDFELLKDDQSKLFEIVRAYSTQIDCVATINETKNEFVDMSYMQAIDNITALEAIKLILKENNLQFNENKIIGYGHSQGAYILHLANKLAPHLFTYIIDNSSWVDPAYLYSNRYLFKGVGNAVLSIEFDYMAKSYLKDKKALSLHKHYATFKNGAYIYSLLGTTDNLVDVQDKKMSISRLKFTQFELIDANKVDGEIFKSTNHGLDADFLKLFEYVLERLPAHQNKNKFVEKYTVASARTQIAVDYSSALPLFQFV